MSPRCYEEHQWMVDSRGFMRYQYSASSEVFRP
jgi:hypothetical protein